MAYIHTTFITCSFISLFAFIESIRFFQVFAAASGDDDESMFPIAAERCSDKSYLCIHLII